MIIISSSIPAIVAIDWFLMIFNPTEAVQVSVLVTANINKQRTLRPDHRRRIKDQCKDRNGFFGAVQYPGI
jgi:hypothetical protein